MAIKAPGTYLTVTDNTEYTNSVEVSGTTVAIVGYAKKGPIGEPTYITSYANFRKTFGDPTSVGYSSMAAKNIFSAGGTVLFTRVADDTKASKSVYVVKNGVAAANGYTKFNSSSDVLTGSVGYSNGHIYGLKVIDKNTIVDASATTDDKKYASKIFYIRSPASGKLTQASILSQLAAQQAATSGKYEMAFTGESVAGNYSFGVEVNGENIFGTSADDCPLYVKLSDGEDPSTIVEAINKSIAAGSNAIDVLKIVKNATSSDILALTDTITVLDKDNTTNIFKNRSLSFTLVVDGVSYKPQINLPSTEITYGDLITLLNNAIESSYGVRVESYADSTGRYLVFIREEAGSGYSVEVRSIGGSSEETAEISDLFAVLVSSASSASYFGTYDQNSTAEGSARPANVIITSAVKHDSQTAATGFTAAYDSSLKSVILSTDSTGSGKTINFCKALFGTYLFSSDANVGSFVDAISGQGSLSTITIKRDTTDKEIRFVSGGIIEPTVTTVAVAEETTTSGKTGNYIIDGDSSCTIDEDYFSQLLLIEGDDSTILTNNVTSVIGNTAISSTKKDMVAIYSKEKGEGTSNISVEKYTSVSPVDGTKTYTIYVYIDGSLKEQFDDVSLVYADSTTRFDTVINQTPESGGSSYISIDIEKNDTTATDVEFPDGTYYLGISNKDGDVSRTTAVDITDYDKYDYSLGNDGIPDESGDELFEEALSTSSALSNREIFSYDILITPDDINETVQDAAIALCAKDELTTYIADPPVGLSEANIVLWHNGKYNRSSAITSKFAEVYSPWCKVYDSNTSKYIWVMPSVLMAAKFVDVDESYGCWYAPAGTVNGVLNAVDIENYYSADERTDMYVDYNRVNPIVKDNNGNIMAYGEKTCQRKNTVLTKVHTVRMVLQIKKRLQNLLKGYIYQPTTSKNLSLINATVSAVMETYKTGGGISSYNVVCDSSNNTTETLQQDIINVDVSCVPVGTIEQIEINLSLNKSASTTAE